MARIKIDQKLTCFHCGEECLSDKINSDTKIFCCSGCLSVYHLLNDGNLSQYYEIVSQPGLQPGAGQVNEFGYLNDPQIIKKLLNFEDEETARVTFNIPQIHCSSCIWLLENLTRLDHGVINSRVDFPRRQLHMTFDKELTNLKQIVTTLSKINYLPEINLSSLNPEKKQKRPITRLYTRLGLAGFCFANIMLLSFPDYLTGSAQLASEYQKFFGYISILLALPVLLFSSREFFSSAYSSLRYKAINIDLPISLGIIVLFTRSLYEILLSSGSGYMDSFSGLVFFLLVGRVFQQKTYDSLNFERDFQSYFPISVLRRTDGNEESISLSNLKVGDRIIIRNNEIIPADALLLDGNALIDYSFVTGESEPTVCSAGDLIYAGGRQTGDSIELETVKEVSQGYLTSLWNKDTFKEDSQSKLTNLVDHISKYFTAAVLFLATTSAVYWLIIDPSKAANAATAVLIVACPCALALASPFALGTAMRLLGRFGLFAKNSTVIESMAKIDTIVFDKTGTLTKAGENLAVYTGEPLSEYDKGVIKSLVRHSSHLLSQKIYRSINGGGEHRTFSFREVASNGLEAIIDGRNIRIGSLNWVYPEGEHDNLSIATNYEATQVYLNIENGPSGFFSIANIYREGLSEMIANLSSGYSLHLLSGDNDSEKKRLQQIFKSNSDLHFEQSPTSKLSYINELTNKGQKVLMLGDGLNDAGAIGSSNVGIAVSEDMAAFSPACDGILNGSALERLPQFLKLASSSILIIKLSFAISFLYNLVGLYFAMRGELTPLIAAILMPLSSITVVAFTTASIYWIAKRKGLT